jgi:TonB family protein
MKTMTSSAVLNKFTPKNLPGALLVAAAIHGLLYATIILVLGSGFFKSTEMPMVDAEIGYEILDAPPVKTEVVAKVRHQEEAPPEPKVKADPAAREIQDDKSDVTGTSQASVVKPAQVGSEGQGDANATPFYKIKPLYPKAALISGDEGYVDLKIDVNEQGGVENIRVIGGEKRNMFQNEARRAVEQWKYRPFLDKDGHAIRKADYVLRVNFKISDTVAANQT